MTERFRPYAAVYLVLKKDGKILMAKRKNTGWQDGNYSLVSGHLDGGESAIQGLIREVKEEVGIDLEEKDLKFVQLLHRYRPEREYISIFFEAANWSGKIINLEPDKCDDISWFPENKLPKNIAPEVKLALENIDKNQFYSEDGFNDL